MEKQNLSSSSSTAADKPAAVPLDNLPVHEYWLEHKRAMSLELQAQRSAMLYEITSSQRSALLGIELVRSKLEEDIEAFYTEYRQILNAVNTTLEEQWRKVQVREKSLFVLQQQLNDALGLNLRAAKEHVMRNAELESSYQERKEQLEEWAQNCQDIILKREEELGATARKLDSDMSAIMVARKRLQSYDREVASRPGTVARIVSEKKASPTATSTTNGSQTPRTAALLGPSAATTAFNNTNKYTDDDVYQVPVGEAFDLTFQLELNEMPNTIDRKNQPKLADFKNLPVTLSYVEGKGGQIWGTVQTLVDETGRIELNGVKLEAKGGSSHILLVSIPRSIHGNVHPLEVRIHVYTVPKIDVLGAWKPDTRTLVGRVRLRHAEVFSVANAKMAISLFVQRNDPGAKSSSAAAVAGVNLVSAPAGEMRSISASSLATTSISNANNNNQNGRYFKCEAEGDGQNDFPFQIQLPNHVWEELESSTLTLEFKTPNLTVFPAIEHKFDVEWMKVESAPSTEINSEVDQAEFANRKSATKIPMFRHPAQATSAAEPLSMIPTLSNIPKTDLITDFAISDSGNLLLFVEVSGKISLYRYEFPHKWVLARTMLVPGAEDSHIGGASFSKSGNLFAIHDTALKKISVWKVAKVLKHAPPASQVATPTELETPEFEIDYAASVLPRDKTGKLLSQPHGNNNLPDDAMIATHFKPVEDVLGTAVLVQTPALGLYLFSSDKNRRPALLVDPRGQNAVRCLFHKVLPSVGSVAVLGFDNGEVIATATNATKATGKRVQFRFNVVKGSPVVSFSDGPTPDSFLVCTICSVCIVKTQPTWSVIRSSYVTSSPISCVSFGQTPKGVTLDEEEKDGIAIVCHSNGLMASVGIVSGCVLGTVMLPEVGENQLVPTIASAQCADVAELGVRLLNSTSLKPTGWEVKLISPAGDPGSRPPIPVTFNKQAVKVTSGGAVVGATE
jgi:hypothetical protein